jgi:hypothetical protein
VFGVLTSVHQQEVYVKATKERRKKGTVVNLKQDYLLVAIPSNEVNIHIIPKTNPILPGTNGKPPGTDKQSKVEYSKGGSKSTKKQSTPTVVSTPDASAPATPKTFKQWTEKDFGEALKSFTNQHPKERLRAFFDYWREKSAAGKMRLQLERTWDTKSRLETWERNEAIFGKKTKQNSQPEIKPDDLLKEQQQKLERQKAKYGS